MNNTESLPLLLSIRDAARQLGGVTPRTIENWLARGQLRPVKLGRRTMIPRSEVERVSREGVARFHRERIDPSAPFDRELSRAVEHEDDDQDGGSR